MPEAWIAIALLVLLGFWGCFRLIEKLRREAAAQEELEDRFRWAMRKNINELIVEAIICDDGYEIDPMMQTAIEESIKAYRAQP